MFDKRHINDKVLILTIRSVQLFEAVEDVIDDLALDVMEVAVPKGVKELSHWVLAFNRDYFAVLGIGCLDLQLVAGDWFLIWVHCRVELNSLKVLESFPLN